MEGETLYSRHHFQKAVSMVSNDVLANALHNSESLDADWLDWQRMIIDPISHHPAMIAFQSENERKSKPGFAFVRRCARAKGMVSCPTVKIRPGEMI